MSPVRLFIWLVILIVLAAVGLYVYITAVAGAGGVLGPAEEKNPGYNFSYVESGVVDYGPNGSRSTYMTYSIASRDLSSIEIEGRRYDSPIPSDIYVLDYQPSCVDCASGSEFVASLEDNLRARGILGSTSRFSAVKVNQLARYTSSPMILIVPTGRIPADFLDQSSDANLRRLMDSGSIVIYIGDEPSQAVDATDVTSKVSSSTLSAFGLAYQPLGPNGPGTSSPYNLVHGTYRLTGAGVSLVSNAISVQHLRNGYFVAFPNTVSYGWRGNAARAAGDVVEFIYQAAWQEPVTTGNKVTDLASSSQTTVDTLVLNPSADTGGYVRLYLTARYMSPSGEVVFRRDIADMNVTNTVKGHLFHTATSVNGSFIEMALQIRESFSEPEHIPLYLTVYHNSKRVSQTLLESPTTGGAYDNRDNYLINLSGGDYILRLTDYNDQTGRVYAQSFLRIPDVLVRNTFADWNADQQKFSFVITSNDGLPVPEGTAVTATVDGGSPVQLFAGAAGEVHYSPGVNLGYGAHRFAFQATGKTLTLELKRASAPCWICRLENQLIIGATIIIVLLGIALQRTESPRYFLDVPDFPPQRRERVPLQKYGLIGIFESTNVEYRWKFMPLTIQEIKANVRKKLRSQGRPIMISDYNLEKLLSQLIASGEVFKDSGLYGLTSWLSQSGKTARFLSVFRLLRNFLITNAVMFTEVGARPECDTLINYRGETSYIQVFEGDDAIRRAIGTAKHGRNYVVFASRDDQRDFERKLATSSTRIAVALKMEMDNRQIHLVSVESLGKIIGLAS